MPGQIVHLESPPADVDRATASFCLSQGIEGNRSGPWRVDTAAE